jgi:outer membrane protein TolC
MTEAESRYRTAIRETETARETWRIEELKYRKGAGSVTDSLLAQAGWFQADARRLAAIYDFHVAKTEYRFAAGLIDICKWTDCSKNTANTPY